MRLTLGNTFKSHDAFLSYCNNQRSQLNVSTHISPGKCGCSEDLNGFGFFFQLCRLIRAPDTRKNRFGMEQALERTLRQWREAAIAQVADGKSRPSMRQSSGGGEVVVRMFYFESEYGGVAHLIIFAPADQEVPVGRGRERCYLATMTPEGQTAQLAHLLNVPKTHLLMITSRKKRIYVCSLVM